MIEDDRIPAWYRIPRPWLRHAFMALCVALPWGSAPWWVTALAVVGLGVQFLPGRGA